MSQLQVQVTTWQPVTLPTPIPLTLQTTLLQTMTGRDIITLVAMITPAPMCGWQTSSTKWLSPMRELWRTRKFGRPSHTWTFPTWKTLMEMITGRVNEKKSSFPFNLGYLWAIPTWEKWKIFRIGSNFQEIFIYMWEGGKSSFYVIFNVLGLSRANILDQGSDLVWKWDFCRN